MQNHNTITLPDLLELTEYKGNWELYEEALFKQFKHDFIDNTVYYKNQPILIGQNSFYKGKPSSFWHMISEGKDEEERLPQLRRCERIKWPKSLIENCDSGEIFVWGNTRSTKRGIQKRIVFSVNDFSYIVVLGQVRNGYVLITAYCVEESHRRDKMKKEYVQFIDEFK